MLYPPGGDCRVGMFFWEPISRHVEKFSPNPLYVDSCLVSAEGQACSVVRSLTSGASPATAVVDLSTRCLLRPFLFDLRISTCACVQRRQCSEPMRWRILSTRYRAQAHPQTRNQSGKYVWVDIFVVGGCLFRLCQDGLISNTHYHERRDGLAIWDRMLSLGHGSCRPQTAAPQISVVDGFRLKWVVIWIEEIGYVRRKSTS